MTRLANGTGKIWGLPVLWLWHRKPEPPQVIVVFVDTATGTVLAAAEPAAVTGKAVRALPAAVGDAET